MNREEKLEYFAVLQEKNRRLKYEKINSYFPDKGRLRRELYPKHLDFFRAGKDFEERLALAANRIGKTESMGGYEVACHLTGEYPSWWEGRRFNRPIEAWAAGKTGQTVRDIIQKKLLGPKADMGSGLIKKHLIHDTTPRQGIPDAIDTVYVKHVSGGISELGFKSYDQKRQSFEGTKKDVIWMDEECPIDIYSEALLRTTDTTGLSVQNGIVIVTFTPLMGLSELVLSFLNNGEIPDSTIPYVNGSKCVISATWDDVPHLTEETKQKLLASIPPFQRDARSKGIPQLGAGAIYPVPESDFLVDDFQIPDHWPRAYGLDVGWNRTAAAWAAWDRETDVIYLYSEHYRGQAEPSIHAEAIRARGDWIPGVLDPAARGRSQIDGEKLMDQYIDLGLDIEAAQNSVESGIYEVWSRLSTGRLKVCRSLSHWLSEFRLYRRDEKGKIVKKDDHLMDATRYLIVSGMDRAKVKPPKRTSVGKNYSRGDNTAWMS